MLVHGDTDIQKPTFLAILKQAGIEKQDLDYFYSYQIYIDSRDFLFDLKQKITLILERPLTKMRGTFQVEFDGKVHPE